jgi:light-regulated signal transduction histidine kinase (bacteriophytochrome)
MGALIDDLLVFSRMSRAELRCSRVSTDSLVHEAVEGLQTEINGRHINWKIDALPEVDADPAMLQQVWVNLISNAVKYTRPRDPAKIEIGCADSGNGEYIFFVHDNGVGFDMQYAHKLFGVFQRLHRLEEFEGTGIGLANVSRIVHRHGGRVWAEAKPDAGATFYFSLPKTSTETNV